MDLKYYKDRISDELVGAKWYAKNAIETKALNPEASKVFLEMSSTELEHAASLFSMFRDYYSKISKVYDEVPEYISEIKEEIVDNYTEMSTKVKFLHEMYKK